MKKIGFLFLVLLLVTLSACGGQKPENSVTSALNAMKADDIKTAQGYFIGDHANDLKKETDGKSEKMAKNLLQNLTFSIEKTSVNGDKAIVTTKITNVDMSKFMGAYVKKLLGIAFSGGSTEDMDAQSDKLLTTMFGEKNDTVTATVDVELDKKDGEWKINPSDEFLDAVLGGLLTATQSMGKGMEGSDELSDIQNWLTSDIWNHGFCDIDSYIVEGTDCTGATMDLDFTLKRLAKAMDKKAGYDAYIKGLKGDQYTDLKETWGKLSQEIDRLYEKLQTSKPTAKDTSYTFDLGPFQQYSDAFDEDIDHLDSAD